MPLGDLAMYVRLGIAALILIAFSLMGATVYKYKSDAAIARAEAVQAKLALDTAVAVNKVQEATIGRLRAESERNGKITAELAQKLADANAALFDLNDSRNILKEDDATVRDYLRTPVPEPLRRLYDR